MPLKPALSKRVFLAVVAASALTIACSVPANTRTKTTGCIAGNALGQSDAGLEQISLCVTSGGKKRAFTVEVARSSAEQAKGMMFRDRLTDDKGMLFPFAQAKVASFWMRNTVIPLDIIFIRANGSIESIAENAIPYSTDPVEAGEPVAAVLELRGGLTSELGIGPGDTVRWQAK